MWGKRDNFKVIKPKIFNVSELYSHVYLQNFLSIMIVTVILSRKIAGEDHNLKIKRQIIPYHHNEDVTDYNSL